MHYEREFALGYAEVQELYVKQALTSGRKGLIGFSVVGALVGLLYHPVKGAALAVFCLTLGVCTGLLLTGLLVIVTKRQVKKTIRGRRAENYTQSVRLDGFGVHVTVDGKTATRHYDQLERVWETKKAFYVFITEKDAWILPKSQMEDPAADSRKLREIFRTLVMSGKLKLKNH